MLVSEPENLDATDDNERRIASDHLNAKLKLLNERIISAQVIESEKQSSDKVWFGAIVTLKTDDETKLRKYWKA